VTATGIEFLTILGQFGDKFSEDCLTINVWTKPQAGEAKKAVLVWIYGGAFSSGNSDNLGYNGQHFAEDEDVVLVSLNYRLNVFGFPGTPNATQNLGLLDQRLAVEWVRDNIEAFGGDPSRITLFGQSAGSASVDYYTYAWTSDPIASGFIQESGSVFGPVGGLGAITAEAGANYWSNLASALQCGNSSSTLSCMKGKSTTDITNAMTKISNSAGQAISSTFGPTIDEKVVFSDYLARSKAGNLTKLPLLLGNADNEAGLFRILDALKNVSLPDAYWDGFNSVAFVCPASTRANVSISNNIPTWRYRWFGAFPNSELSTIPYSGAWHASELQVLFGNYPVGNGIPNSTAAELGIATYIRGAWAAFAKDPKEGLMGYGGGWPVYEPTGQTLVRLAWDNQTGTNLALGTAYDGACPVVIAAGSGNGSGNGTATATGSATGSTPTHTGGAVGGIVSGSGMLGVAVVMAFAAL
jgi:cholinesterase